MDLIEEITNTLDRGEFAVTLFLDLSKALNDTVNHHIPLSKLSHYGIKIMHWKSLVYVTFTKKGSKEFL